MQKFNKNKEVSAPGVRRFEVSGMEYSNDSLEYREQARRVAAKTLDCSLSTKHPALFFKKKTFDEQDGVPRLRNKAYQSYNIARKLVGPKRALPEHSMHGRVAIG